MHEAIQKVLDELSEQTDSRVSVFDLQVVTLDNGMLSLSGRLLDQNQFAALNESFARRFPDLRLDTASIRILNKEPHQRFHVATNLIGLYDKPTRYLPFSSELCFGTEVEVLDQTGEWAFTRQTDGYLGWVYRPYLTDGMAPRATHLLLAPSQELLSQPDIESEIVTRVVSGTGVYVEETRGEWAKVIANKPGWMPSCYLRATADLPRSNEEKRATLIEDAARLIGVPYLWGGTSGNGIDCSGLARLLHRWIGLELPRDADMQHAAARPVEAPYEVGDLFFFAEHGSRRKITHVGVSLGGWRMVHSSGGNNGVYTDDLQQRQSLMDAFVSAGSFLR
jgi:hypothetical protein